MPTIRHSDPSMYVVTKFRPSKTVDAGTRTVFGALVTRVFTPVKDIQNPRQPDYEKWYWSPNDFHPESNKPIMPEDEDKYPPASHISYNTLPHQEFVEQLHSGAESPDWRPNETIPEDYYAMSRTQQDLVKYFRPPTWFGAAGVSHETLNKWLGRKSQRRLGSNKTIYRDGDDIHVRLHNTNVVTVHPDNDYTVRTGGWHTPTTRRTIQYFTGLPMYSDKKGGSEFAGRPFVEGSKVSELTKAPEQDWRPNEMIPEDYYAMSRASRIGQARLYAKKAIDRGESKEGEKKTALPSSKKDVRDRPAMTAEELKESVSPYTNTGDEISVGAMKSAMEKPPKKKPWTKPLKSQDEPGVEAGKILREKPDKIGWHKKPVNKGIHPSIEGTRLGVILHEIRDDFGKKDPMLIKLAKSAMQGVTGLVSGGTKLFTDIRDRLLSLGARGDKRAEKIAKEYNWHRVNQGLHLDEAVKNYVKSIAKEHLKGSNEILRKAHNLYGYGWEKRKRTKPVEQKHHDAFWEGLKNHLKATKFWESRGTTHEQGMKLSDTALKNSLWRIAQQEENLHGNPSQSVHGDINYEGQGSGLKNLASPPNVEARDMEFRKAWTGDPKGGVRTTGRTHPGQYSRQYARSSPLIEGIRFTSHPNGKYDDTNHLAANVEQAALRHALNSLGLVTPKQGSESNAQYTSRLNNAVHHWAKNVRNYVHSNPKDMLSRYYNEGADRLVIPGSGSDPTSDSPHYSLPTPTESPLSMAGRVAPILRMLAENFRVRPQRPVAWFPERDIDELNIQEPEHPPAKDEDGYHDLLSPDNGQDLEDRAASILHRAGKQLRKPAFGSGKPLVSFGNIPAVPEDLGVIQPPKGSTPDIDEIEGYQPKRPKPRGPRLLTDEVKQSIANHLANGGTFDSTLQHLQEKHGMTRPQAQAQYENYKKLKQKPQGVKEQSSPQKPSSISTRQGVKRKKYARLPQMQVTVYGRTQGSNPRPSRISLTTNPGSSQRQEHIHPLWGQGEELGHQFSSGTRDKSEEVRGILADWLDENSEHLQSIPEEYRPYVGHLLRNRGQQPLQPEEPYHASRPSRYAMAAPAGDLIVGYNNYKGGQRIPSKNGGEFIKAAMSPPKFNPVKMAAARAKWSKKYPKPCKVASGSGLDSTGINS